MLNEGIPSMLLFPNPARDQVSLYLPSTQKAFFELQDLLGQKICNLQPVTENPEFVSIDISGLPSGAYFLKVSFEGTYVIKKLIIAR